MATTHHPPFEIDQVLWARICAFINRLVKNHSTAEDLTQELLLKFERNQSLDRFADQKENSQDHLWNFLAKSARNHALNYFRSMKAASNRLRCQTLSLDEVGDAALTPTTEDPTTEIQINELEAAVTRAEERLRVEFKNLGRLSAFRVLQPHLHESKSDLSSLYDQLSITFKLSEAGARSCLHRARHRFREIVREEMAASA